MSRKEEFLNRFFFEKKQILYSCICNVDLKHESSLWMNVIFCLQQVFAFTTSYKHQAVYADYAWWNITPFFTPTLHHLWMVIKYSGVTFGKITSRDKPPWSYDLSYLYFCRNSSSVQNLIKSEEEHAVTISGGALEMRNVPGIFKKARHSEACITVGRLSFQQSL